MKRSGWYGMVGMLLLLPIVSGCGFQERVLPEQGFETWSVYGGDAGFRHYSRLDQINRSNVHLLQTAWTYDSGDAFRGSQIQANPIVVNGTLYSTTPANRVIALNAATGEVQWTFATIDTETRARALNRGVTYWNGDGGRIFATAQHWLYALDAATGAPVVTFGDSGRVDLRRRLGRDPESLNIGARSPGVIYKDMLILGSNCPEGLPSAPGDIRAFDCRTGTQRWSFHTIPHPGEPGYETWPPEAWTYIGGANSWPGLCLDEERGIVFASTGSAAFDFWGGNRLGDNLYANCVLALNADTGEKIWHFQGVKHDAWDRDFPAAPTLVTVKRDGRLVDAVAQITKSGFVFVFDRETGESLFPIEYRDVPPSDIPGEVLAEQQPFPLAPPPFARQMFTEDLVTQRTPAARDSILTLLRSLKNGPQFTPLSRQGTVVFPGFDGGGEWGGAAFDPETGLLYINANELPWYMRLIEREAPKQTVTGGDLYRDLCASCHGDQLQGIGEDFPPLTDIRSKYSRPEIEKIVRTGTARMPGFDYLSKDELNTVIAFVLGSKGTRAQSTTSVDDPSYVPFTHDGYHRILDPDGYPGIQPPWGTLNALDLDAGNYRWQKPLGFYPELAKQGMTDTGTQNYGGPAVTAGGLVFIGATIFDNKIRAFDKLTGELLWDADLPFAGQGTPAVYEVNGRQFVVIPAGGGKLGTPAGAVYVAFTLPENGQN